MGNFVPVAKAADLDPNGGLAVQVKGRLIALFLQDGEVRALDDCCPHMGGPLSEGSVRDGIVMCPWHAWRFRVQDGCWLDAPQSGTRVNAYNAKIEGDQVLLEVNW